MPESVSLTKSRILVLSSESPQRWTDLLEATGITPKALLDHLNELQRRRWIEKDRDGSYVTTEAGRRVLKEAGGMELLAVEAAKEEAEAETRETLKGRGEKEGDLFRPSWALRSLATQEFEVRPMTKAALTLGGFALLSIKRQVLGPLKGVEAKYADWLMGLMIRAVDYESAKLTNPAAVRRFASALWLEAEGFVHKPLFDYERSFEHPANQKLLKSLVSEIEGDKEKSEVWLGLKTEFDAGSSKILGKKVSLGEAEFAKVLGWLRVKLVVLGGHYSSKEQPRLLESALKSLKVDISS
jgi:DNA-binding HxlR family transcriptional regulator